MGGPVTFLSGSYWIKLNKAYFHQGDVKLSPAWTDV